MRTSEQLAEENADLREALKQAQKMLAAISARVKLMKEKHK